MHKHTHTPTRKYVNVYNLYIHNTHIYTVYIYIHTNIYGTKLDTSRFFKTCDQQQSSNIENIVCDPMDPCGGYPPVIKHGNEHSPKQMEVFEGPIIYKWWMFNRHSRIPVLSCPPIKCWMLSGRNTDMSWEL